MQKQYFKLMYYYTRDGMTKVDQQEIETGPKEVFINFTASKLEPEIIINLKRNESLAIERKTLA